MDIRSMNLEEMEALAISLGEKAFRGKQLFQWVHEKQADDFDEMTNLSAAFREKLKENYCISGVRQVEKQVSKKEDTAKYLFALEDDHVIESVWMKYRHGNSVCISSQVGCRMGCTFCASTLTGLTRNLTAGEMLSQIYQIQKDTKESQSLQWMTSGINPIRLAASITARQKKAYCSPSASPPRYTASPKNPSLSIR